MSSSETIRLYPQVDARDLGPHELDLRLYATGAHSSAHAVRSCLQIVNDGALVNHAVTHPAPTASYRLAPSLVQVESTQRSVLSLYTFGCNATSCADSNLSIIHLESVAPIIMIGKSLFDNDLNPVDMVVNEFQAWLSILRARSARDLPAFYRQLVQISPETLYLQALFLAERTLGSIPVDERSERFYRSRRVIQASLAAAQKRPGAATMLPNLETLLSARGYL